MVAGVALLCPMLAQAHTADIVAGGWVAGFSHPLHGWDHLVAMAAVGLWAAQQRGRAVWAIPLSFVLAMAVGGVVGYSGERLLGTETIIVISVIVLVGLAVTQARPRAGVMFGLISFFAFFHGYAHGEEMPGSANFLLFGAGFVVATALLHALGFVSARAIALVIAFVLGTPVMADETSAASGVGDAQPRDDDSGTGSVPEVIVTGRGDSQIGMAASASQGNIGAEQLQYRPMTRPGEILETVPGLIVTQHSGEGKANQYYLRGFNLDHGTDFLTQLDGVPLNLVSHAHGQGWTDTGFLIPELVRTIRYQKGVYYAENGDFSGAGAADIRYADELPDAIASFDGGDLDYYRGLYAASSTVGDGTLLYALEGVYNDGPWQHGDHYRKLNGVLRYSLQRGNDAWSLSLLGYQADWNSTDQIPKRAVEQGLLSRFGAIDSTDGGDSQRYSVSGTWQHDDAHGVTRVVVYGYYDQLDLFSDFTYFLADPARGDQFAQPDERYVAGLKVSHTFAHALGSASSETTIGVQNRNDVIDNGLLLTQGRDAYATVRRDSVVESSISPYAENATRWSDWLRSTLGVRFDAFRFDVASDRAPNSGERWDTIVSPKGGLVFGPWAATELYLNAGLGFHSNDARGVNTRIDPSTGLAVEQAAPLVRNYGAETGLRTTWLPGLQSTFALWELDSDSELIFVGDAGTTEAGRPSRRYGMEIANYYTPRPWLSIDADISLSKSRFRDRAPEGEHIPGSVETVISAGATVRDWHRVSGGLRLRYFGPRALLEDDSVRSSATLLLSADLSYRLTRVWTVRADVFNLLGRNDSDIDYYYPSRLRGEAPGPDDGGYNDVHFHPVEPRSFRLGIAAHF